MSKLLEDKRKGRGLKMGALIGEAASQGELFWKDENWATDGASSTDDSFDEIEEKPDVFDSDFNESEDDGSDEEVENPVADNTFETKRKSNKFVEPTAKRTQKKSMPKSKQILL